MNYTSYICRSLVIIFFALLQYYSNAQESSLDSMKQIIQKGKLTIADITKGNETTAINSINDPVTKNESIHLAIDDMGLPDIFSGTIVSKPHNPMLEQECRNTVYTSNLEKGGSKAKAHVIEMRETFKNKGITYEEYFTHLSKCPLCGPIAAELAYCHVLSVANSPRSLVLFDYDSDVVVTKYLEGQIKNFANELKVNPKLKVALFGRASKTGKFNYNLDLSFRRAYTVENLLKREGISSKRIYLLGFGWEEPYITEAVAKDYGYLDLYSELRDTPRLDINQSVIMVLYEELDGHDH